MFVRSSCTLDQNLGLVCDYAAAYPETHYNNKKCAVRSALCAASALCAEPEHSIVGGSKKKNKTKHRKYRNCDRPSQLSQRDSYAVETPGTGLCALSTQEACAPSGQRMRGKQEAAYYSIKQ